jgi:5,6-dimethylbenzimidazole synthase
MIRTFQKTPALPRIMRVSGDRSRGGPAVLGRNTVPETDVYSTCCAIQNLWLAARAEGIGVGWVSILDPEAVKQALAIPTSVVLVAYLCLGYPIEFDDQPMLEKRGWGSRLPLAELVFEDSWNQKWLSPVACVSPV